MTDKDRMEKTTRECETGRPFEQTGILERSFWVPMGGWDAAKLVVEKLVSKTYVQ